MNKTLFLLYIIFTLFSCKKHHVCDEELTLKKRPYLGSEIRTDGYYYLAISEKVYRIAIMYKDGVLISKNFGGVGDLQSVDKVLQSTDLLKTGLGLVPIKQR